MKDISLMTKEEFDRYGLNRMKIMLKMADEDALKDIRYHYKISKRIKRLKVIMKDKNIIDIS